VKMRLFGSRRSFLVKALLSENEALLRVHKLLLRVILSVHKAFLRIKFVTRRMWRENDELSVYRLILGSDFSY